MDDTTGVVRHDVRLPPEDTKVGKEIVEKFTTQQDFIHYVQLVEAMGEEAVVGIKSCEWCQLLLYYLLYLTLDTK